MEFFFFGGGCQCMQILKPDSASADFYLVLKRFDNNTWWPHTRREWQLFFLSSFPPLYWSHFFFIHHFHFYFRAEHWVNSHETKQNLHTVEIWVRQYITCWGVRVGRFLTFIYKEVQHWSVHCSAELFRNGNHHWVIWKILELNISFGWNWVFQKYNIERISILKADCESVDISVFTASPLFLHIWIKQDSIILGRLEKQMCQVKVWDFNSRAD